MDDQDSNSNSTPLLGRRPFRQRSGKYGDPVTDKEEDDEKEAPKVYGCGNIMEILMTPKNIEVACGPFLGIILYCVAQYRSFGSDIPGSASPQTIGVMLGTLAWMACWWIMLPVPIAVTALLPLCLFPFFGVMSAEKAAKLYMSDIVTLMLGNFIFALAITKYDVHKRMALNILLAFGGEKMNPRLVLAGFVVGPAFISAFMSNTSCAAMMIPMATGVLETLHPDHHVTVVRVKSSQSVSSLAEMGQSPGTVDIDEEKHAKEAEAAIFKYGQGVILGVTYGIAIGGMSTIIGSGPDLVMPGLYSSIFPGAPELTFVGWMEFAVPLVVVILIPLWLFLSRRYCPYENVHVIEASLNRTTIERAYKDLGPTKFAEVFIMIEFVLIVLLWVTRSFGQQPGWSYFFNNFPGDGTVAIMGAIILFVVPDFQENGVMLMDWKSCKNISWSVILLLGGGFALSGGIQESGVSTWIGQSMDFFSYIPYLLLTPTLSIMLGVITEFTSNAAVATLFLPIFADVAVHINVHPLLLMLPTTFASSYAFIFPSGAPPNAIACGTGYLTVVNMVRPGLFLHMVGTIALSVFIPTLGAVVFGLNEPASSLPWVN